ncbi:MAG: 50S ribosomal protein L15 [Deltaproteobacteria bacterium]|nr:MAG: 50S ribosomal protein L15 [Deltaproteobacteria bacterium]
MLNRLKAARGGTSSKKRVGRGSGSGMGKTSTRGHKGYGARSGSKVKAHFEGGQQPIYKRLPKVGFVSKVQKPFALNVDRFALVKELKEITINTLVEKGFVRKNILKVKLIGKGAQALKALIKDENITLSKKYQK